MSSHQPFNTHGANSVNGTANGNGHANGNGQGIIQHSSPTGLGPHGGHALLPGEVGHIHYLSEHIGALYLNDDYSDVTLIVKGKRFQAHRVILAARSEYFR